MRNQCMTQLFKLSCLGAFTAMALLSSGCSEAQSADVPASSTQHATHSNAPVPSETGNWDIIADASHIRFTAQQEGVDFSGAFTAFSGIIAFDPEAPERGSVRIDIPLAGVDAGSKDRNSTLPSKLWFSTRKFPTAVFRSSDMSRTAEGYVAKGVLSLKGVSAPVELPFTLDVKAGQAVMTGQVILDRTAWNVGAAPWDTDEWVSKDVRIDISVRAQRHTP